MDNSYILGMAYYNQFAGLKPAPGGYLEYVKSEFLKTVVPSLRK